MLNKGHLLLLWASLYIIIIIQYILKYWIQWHIFFKKKVKKDKLGIVQ